MDSEHGWWMGRAEGGGRRAEGAGCGETKQELTKLHVTHHKPWQLQTSTPLTIQNKVKEKGVFLSRKTWMRRECGRVWGATAGGRRSRGLDLEPGRFDFHGP